MSILAALLAIVAAILGLQATGEGVSEADGVLPEAVSVFDEGYAGVSRLDPALLEAVRRAATDASGQGVAFHVTSGWRSPHLQEHLLEDAVHTYGSREEAARWVATPATSAHVSGEAIDVGGPGATDWLARHGSAYGLCQIYANEPWHYELRPGAADQGCPRMYADATEDPRLRE